jgi:hypothetical protein
MTCYVFTFLGDATDYETAMHFDENGNTFGNKPTYHSLAYLGSKYTPAYLFAFVAIPPHMDDVQPMLRAFYEDIELDFTNQFRTQTYRELPIHTQQLDTCQDNNNWNELAWTILETIDNLQLQWNKQDQVVIDITHGYRVMPYFGILLFRYFKLIKGIQNVHISYGHLRKRDEINADNHHVYFSEVTSISHLEDWIDAANLFIRAGQASRIIELLTPYMLPTALQQITEFTEMFQLVNWPKFRSVLQKMGNNMKDLVNPENKYYIAEPQARYAIEWILKEYAVLITVANKPYNASILLELKRHILKFYIDRNMYTQALILAREYLLTRYLFNGVHPKNGGKLVCIDNTTYNSYDFKSLLNKKVRDWNNDANPYTILRPSEMYPCNIEIGSEQKNFGTLVFTMRNSVGHGIQDMDLSPEIIEKVMKLIINDNDITKPSNMTTTTGVTATTDVISDTDAIS